VVIPANLKIGWESTVLSRGEACENTQKTRLSIKTERYLVVYIEKLVQWGAPKSPQVTLTLTDLEIAIKLGHCRKVLVVSILKSLIDSKISSGFNIEITSEGF
jgi:hypothetical protein